MKLKIVPPQQGWAWLRQGLLVCRQQPMGFVGLLGMVIFAALAISAVPLIGPLVVVGAMPLAWLGFMNATRRALAKERVLPAVMIEAVRRPDSPRPAFAKLGGWYVLATLLVMQLAGWLGPGPDVIADVFESANDLSAVLSNPQVQQDLLWRMVLTLPVSLVFWHAPALILWAKLPVGKALFFSAVACWRNLGAFVAYGLGWLALLAGLVLIDQLVLWIVPSPTVATMLVLAAGMWLAAAFYASLFFTVADCFEATEEMAAGQPVNPSDA